MLEMNQQVNTTSEMGGVRPIWTLSLGLGGKHGLQCVIRWLCASGEALEIPLDVDEDSELIRVVQRVVSERVRGVQQLGRGGGPW